MIEYFDSHCHLTAAAFRDDREAVLRTARDVGVRRLVTIASNVMDSREALKLATDRAGVWSTAGIHPHEVGGAKRSDLDEIGELASKHGEIVGIGETGLDYHYDTAPRSTQRAFFDAHLEIGADLGLPVVVHARDADDDVAEALRDMPPGTSGVLHCFTGGVRTFEEALSSGWYVSFSGIVSFNSFKPVDLLQEVPSDRLLIETDAPYLAPIPKRGRRNEPANVVHVAEAVATQLGLDPTEVARETAENACRLYGVE